MMSREPSENQTDESIWKKSAAVHLTFQVEYSMPKLYQIVGPVRVVLTITQSEVLISHVSDTVFYIKSNYDMQNLQSHNAIIFSAWIQFIFKIYNCLLLELFL